MKSISGKKFAKLLERKGWILLQLTVVIISTVNLGLYKEHLFQFTAIRR